MASDSHPQAAAGETDLPPSDTGAPRSQSAESASRGVNRWLLSLIGLVICVILLLVLPGHYPLIVLIGLVGLALVIAARDSGFSAAGFMRDIGRFRGNLRSAAAKPNDAETGIANRERLSRQFAFTSLGLMIVAAIGFRPDADSSLLMPAFFMLLGGTSLGMSLWLAPRVEPIATANNVPLAPERSNWFVMVAGVTLLAILTFINAGKLTGDTTAVQVTLHAEFLLLFGGIALIVWGLAGAPRQSPRQIVSRISWAEAAPLLLIFALGLGLRIWGLDTTIRNSVDEAVVIEGVNHAGNYPAAGIVTQVSDRLSASQLFPYWQRLAIDVFGHTLTGLRMTNAIVGALNIFAIYLLANALFDRKTALIAAFILATFPPHLHFSRIAMAHIADPLFGTLALAFLVRGLKFNRRIDWALAGASLGLTQYFFEGGRLLFPPLFIGCVVLMALWLRGHLRTHWRGLVVAFLTMVFVIAPIYYQIFAFDRARTTRMADSGVGVSYFTGMLDGGISGDEFNALVERVTFPFTLYVHQPEIAAFYGGHTAMVLEYFVPIFLLGVFYMLWRLRSPAMVVVAWLVIAGLGNTLMRDMAVYARFIVVLPALALTMAVGLRYVLPLLWPERRPDLLVLPLVALTTIIGMVQVTYYFGTHVPAENAQLRAMARYDGMDAVLRAADQPHEGTQVIMIGQEAFDGEVARIFDTFLSGRGWDYSIVSIRAQEVTDDWLATLTADKDYIFMIAPDSESVVGQLQQYFRLSDPQYSPYEDVPDEKEYAMYFGSRN